MFHHNFHSVIFCSKLFECLLLLDFLSTIFQALLNILLNFEYLEKSEELVKVVKKKRSEELMDLMQISQKIAELNVNRFNSWHLPFSKENSKQAVLAFKGDVYSGLNANNLSENKLKYAQKHLRIISGLYGDLTNIVTPVANFMIFVQANKDTDKTQKITECVSSFRLLLYTYLKMILFE